MPAEYESRDHNFQAVTQSRFKRAILYILFALVGGPLASCGLSPDWRPTPAATATAILSRVPTPVAIIFSSEALYTDKLRHFGMTSTSFASLPAGAVLPPAPSGGSERGVSLLLDTKTTVQGELYQAGSQPEPAILILGADIAAWGALPAELSKAGFVVLALQIGPTTPARQIDVMLQSLIAIPGVNAGAIGLVGEARSADLAMLACSVNTLCDALALFSPTSRETLLNMIPSFGERALWLTASRIDSEAHAAALSLSQGMRARAQFVEVEVGRGAEILNAEPGMAAQLVQWFALQLKNT